MSTRMDAEPFLKLRSMEEKARDLYKEYLERVEDEELKKLLAFLVEQEEGHMMVADKLIEIIS